jgi:heat shock protein HslJ
VRRIAVLVALAALTVAGCSTTGSSSGSPSAVRPGPDREMRPHLSATRGDLVGHTFVATSWTRADKVHATQTGTRFRITFPSKPAATFAATGGCNTASGRFRLAGGRLVVSHQGSTLAGCFDHRAQQDAVIDGLLDGRPTLHLDGTTLVITHDGTTIRARRVR